MPAKESARRTRRQKVSATASEVSLRSPELDDLNDWARLRQALWPEDGLAAHRAATAQRFTNAGPADPAARPGPQRAILALSDGRVVGFAEVSLRAYADGCSTSPVGYLEGLYVLPKFRRRGVAQDLVRAAEAWAVGLGCREMASDAFTTNRGSRRFHAHAGYSEVEVLVHFRKRLPRPRRARRA